MTVDEFFDHIEKEITDSHYMPSKLWDSYIVIAKKYREVIKTNA